MGLYGEETVDDGCLAGAQQPYWVSSGPWPVLLDEGVGDDEQFSHGGGYGDLRSFALGSEVLVEGADCGIEADGGEGCHIERATDREADGGEWPKDT